MNNKKSPTPPRSPADSVSELAQSIYVGMCRTIYSVPDTKKPHPKTVARLSLRLAETFIAANREFNLIAEAAREAENAAGVGGYLNIDFESIGAHRDINAPPQFSSLDGRQRTVRLARAA